MYKIVIFIFCNLAFISCAINQKPDKAAPNWVGVEEIEIVRHLGPPQSTYEIDGSKFLKYVETHKSNLGYIRKTRENSSEGRGGYQRRFDPWQNIPDTTNCEIIFELMDSKVVDVQRRGNGCRN